MSSQEEEERKKGDVPGPPPPTQELPVIAGCASPARGFRRLRG